MIDNCREKLGIPRRTLKRVVRDGYGIEMRSHLFLHKKLTNIIPCKYYTMENANACCSKFMSLPVYLQKDGILHLLPLNKI